MNQEETPGVTYGAKFVGADYSGLPAVSQAMMRVDDIRAAREETEVAERAADHAEQVAFAMRGRDCSLAAILGRAGAEARRSDYRAEREDLAARVAAGEVCVLDGPAPVARSAIPAAEREMDRLIRQHRDDKSWLSGYLQRHGLTDPVTARRMEAVTRPEVSRGGYDGGRQIVRTVPAEFVIS